MRQKPPRLKDNSILVPICFLLLLQFYLLECKISYYKFLITNKNKFRGEHNIVIEVKSKYVRHIRANKC